jgi:hypothetical protein
MRIEWIAFVIGLILGGVAGASLTCLFIVVGQNKPACDKWRRIEIDKAYRKLERSKQMVDVALTEG